MPAPLVHLRVVDLTDLRGALAGRLLADLGADVVKVEPPRGDPGRLVPPFAGGVTAPDRSLPFLYRNANKRGAVLDLHDAGGWRRFCELCERADVLIENLGPEGERRHGLTPAEVHERHPHLVHVALADFGLTGPRAGWRLEALPAFAASGALHASGFRERPPCWLPGYAAHACGAGFAVAGVRGAPRQPGRARGRALGRAALPPHERRRRARGCQGGARRARARRRPRRGAPARRADHARQHARGVRGRGADARARLLPED